MINEKRALLKVFIALFLILALICVCLLDLVVAQPRPPPPLPYYYIRGDGRVEPSTAPILRIKENVYVFTGNVTDHTIMVQRDNIVIDGLSFFIQQTEEAKKIPNGAIISI